MVNGDQGNLRKQGAANLAFRGDDDDDEQKEKIEMMQKFRTGSKSVSFSESSEEPKQKHRSRLNPILPRQKKSLEEDPVWFPPFFLGGGGEVTSF